jgi:ribosomal protein L22
MTPEIEPEEAPKPEDTVDDGPGAAADAAGVDPEAVAPAEPPEVPSEPQADDREGEDEDEDEDQDEGEQPEGDEPAEPGAAKRRGLRRRRKASPAPSRPAPSRRRSRRDPNAPIPVVRAQAKYVRSSARKARLVCDHIRGKSVEEARAILALTPRAIARDWSKLLESAVANAEHNHELVGEDLYVKAVHADEGPTIKRFRPRAMGRATRIRKRTSHLTILLTPKE